VRVGVVVVVGASCLGHPVAAAASMFSCHTSCCGCCHDLLVDRGLGTVDAVNPMHCMVQAVNGVRVNDKRRVSGTRSGLTRNDG